LHFFAIHFNILPWSLSFSVVNETIYISLLFREFTCSAYLIILMISWWWWWFSKTVKNFFSISVRLIILESLGKF
jgi:hypothetical protein